MTADRISLAWLLCMMFLSHSILAQQPQDRDIHKKCYKLTTTTHCLRTVLRSGNLLRTFVNASNWCISQGYSLVKIDSPEVQAIVEQFVEEFELTSDDVWIGARRSAQTDWKWVNGDVYSDGSSLPTAEENRTDASVVYLMFDHALQSFEFVAAPNTVRENYICKFSGSTCDLYNGSIGFHKASDPRTCYVIFPQRNWRAKQFWYEARNRCLLEGGDLADENAKHLPLSRDLKYLIGLRRDEIMWTESDQSETPVRLTRFLSGEPSSPDSKKDCVSMSYISQWAWSTRNCSEKVLFVCQKVEPRSPDSCSPTHSTVSPPGGDSEKECFTDDQTVLIGLIVGCVVVYVLSIILVISITACICRSRGSAAQSREAPTFAYQNDSNDYLDPNEVPNIYNDVRK